MDFFIPYRGKTLEDWVSKVKCIPETICVEPPTIKDRTLIVENLKSIEEERYLICYYYSIYNKYHDKLFNYLGGFTNISKIDFDSLVLNTMVFEDFINILASSADNQVDIKDMSNDEITLKGRHDACIVPRAAAVVEAGVALCLLNLQESE